MAIRDDAADIPGELADNFSPLEFDERAFALRDAVTREGQGAFRLRLLHAYGGRCAITGEHTEPVLDAAHIQPYLGPRSNHLQNGLLLTKEFHALLDEGYVGAGLRDSRQRAAPYRVEQRSALLPLRPAAIARARKRIASTEPRCSRVALRARLQEGGMRLDDGQVRAAAFAFLDEQTQARGEVLSWATLLEGFQLDGRRVPLTSQQGIFRPAVLAEMPLTIQTAPAETGKTRPYDDAVGSDGLMLYRYRGTDPQHRENVGLRLAMQRQAPLIYLFGIVEDNTCRCGRFTSSATTRWG